MDKQDIVTYSSKYGSFSWKKDIFDSQILEREVAKILSIETSQTKFLPQLIQQIIASFRKNKIVYATYRFNQARFPLIHALETTGFLLVDGAINLEAKISEKFTDIPQAIRRATTADLSQLEQLANNAFSISRFYNDPLITKEQANKIYSEWIKNSVISKTADEVFVWEDNKKIYGFTTVKKNGNIVLIAVATTQRGKGIAKALVKISLNTFLDWGLSHATIETQTTNISALRAYQSCGFKIYEALVTYRWALK